jgi:carbonic anhydrase/acetyltransferase-like protein (isoleucine patch superfamily)
MLQKNPAGEAPVISETAYVSESAVIIGNVEIKEQVYIAPHATIIASKVENMQKKLRKYRVRMAKKRKRI